MKSVLLTFLFLAPVIAFSQGRDTVFSVKMVQTNIRLQPETDVLYKDITRRFKIIASTTTKIDSIYFSAGKANIKDSILTLKPTRSKTALLKIFAHAGSGSSKLALVKEYKVLTRAEPTANLDGVSSDSAIQRMRAAAMGNLYIPSNNDLALKTRFSYHITSYQLMAGGSDIFAGNGNRLTPAMRNRIDSMPAGGVLQFQNIRYLDDGGDTLTAAPLRVFLLSDPIVKF